MISFKKQFMEDLEKGIRKRLKKTEEVLQKDPSKYGLGTKEAHVPPLEDNKSDLPLMPKYEEPPVRAQWREAQTTSRVTARNLAGGHGSSLRSRFEAMTQRSVVLAETAKTSEEGELMSISPQMLTQGQLMSRKILKKSNKHKSMTLSREISKRRAKDKLLRRIKTGV